MRRRHSFNGHAAAASFADEAADFIVTVNMRKLVRSVCHWVNASVNKDRAYAQLLLLQNNAADTGRGGGGRTVYKKSKLPRLLRMTLLHCMDMFELEVNHSRRKQEYMRMMKVPSAWGLDDGDGDGDASSSSSSSAKMDVRTKFLLLTCALNAAELAKMKNRGREVRRLLKLFDSIKKNHKAEDEYKEEEEDALRNHLERSFSFH